MPVHTLRDGAVMAYADEGAGAPILLAHGWATHGGFFEDLRRKLARTRRVLTPTLRGHVGSDQGAAPLTIETLAEDIAEFAEALDLKNLVGVGWSMGAMALWAATPRLSTRLEGLVVEEMSPRLINDESWQFGIINGYGAGDVGATLNEIAVDWPAHVARFAPRMFAPDTRAARPDLIDWSAAEMAKADAAAMASFWQSMAAQDFRARLATITTPMLVLHGAESQVYPDDATAFVARTAPNGAHIIIPGAGHSPHLEAPDVFFQHIEAFARTARRPDLRSGGAQP